MVPMIEEISNIRASCWISASAGSGKTKKLIDRILVLLLNGIEPSKILCLTYTKAAASEMLMRLADCCYKFHKMSHAELCSELIDIGFDDSFLYVAKSLYEKSLRPEWVSIQTIHSFCFSVLERFPLETGLSPGVKLCDDYQRKKLINESIALVLSDEKYKDHLEIIAEYTTDISEFISDYKMVQIKDFVFKIDNFVELYYDFFNLDKEWNSLGNQEINYRLLAKLFNDNQRHIFCELAEILSTGSASDIKTAEILYRNAECLTEEFVEVFLTKTGELRANLCTQKIKDLSCHDRMRAIAQKALEFCELKKRYITAKANASFFSAVRQIIHKFIELKTIKHCLDYNDVISFTTTLLENTWVMYKIDRKIDHVLVDEAQDTSPEQWEIIKKITNEFFDHYQSNRTIFVVGDEKQSIYSFQGANVKLFTAMHDYFKKRSLACGQKFYDILLNTSYRTTGNILSFVDDIFNEKFPNVKHVSDRNKLSGVVEVVNIFENGDEKRNNNGDCIEKQDTGQKLSIYLADFIKDSIESNIFVESKNRAAKASDFLILFQRRNISTMKNIIYALRNNDIPAVGIDKMLLKDELIVEDLIVFAEFAVFPLDDLMCARCLKSPIVGMTENDLMRACIDRKDEKLWKYLQKNEELYKKYSLEKLKNYMGKAFVLSAYDFFMNALTDGVKEKFLDRLGEQCLEVLYEFLEVVANYEKDNNSSLQNFLMWFRSFEYEIKNESFAEEDAARLTTVHASKGLQSPFVIIADSHFYRAKNDKILQTDENILFWDFLKDCRPNRVIQECEKNLQAHAEEYNRLLYVALTRAEDFLYILGEKHEKMLNEKCWYNLIRSKLDDNKFIKTDRFGVQSNRYGKYSYFSEKCDDNPETTNEPITIPNWFYEKLETSDQEDVGDSTKTMSMIYGDCVHFLLSEAPRYLSHSLFDGIVDSLVENFDLPDEYKKAAKTEAYNVIKKFDFLFDSNSMSEVTFIYKGEEGRIDKIAFQNDNVWVVDFKTGVPQSDVSSEYISQLALYKQAVCEIMKKNETNIRTAVLWTQSLKFIEV
ncbi:MAG: UvrD-helicase domain-containing protein [Holosporaceae bacterium]|jgi:ATP-dependent helicase/nuclease subunit A|nr:UvrD-helicase domain-containing protein [Holosporaceae bacterium]